MTAKKEESQSLDDLLKKALADDLPADVAAGMRDRIDRFRAGTMRDDKPTAARAWFFRRTVWAALSVLMLVAGGLLQGLGSRNRLADRISVLKAEFSSLDSTRLPGVTPDIRVISPDGSPIIRRKNHDRDS
jgi:hypothetical protein